VAALWLNSEVRDIPGNANVGEIKQIIANGLNRAGYGNVHVGRSEVAGGKGASWVSVMYLSIAGNRF